MGLDYKQTETLRRLWGRAEDDIKQDLVAEFDGRLPEIQAPAQAARLFSDLDAISREQWAAQFLSQLSPLARQDLADAIRRA
jgi:hypothetical protein